MASHNAPPVSYPLGRSRFVGVLMAAGWCAAAVVTLAWWLAAARHDLGPWLGLLSLALAGLALWMGWRRAPVGRLAWDGQAWVWQSQGYQQSLAVEFPDVLLDLQRVMLIRMCNQAGASWVLWADAASEPSLWLDLRRALHARPHNAGRFIHAGDRSAQP